jgi:hypothetical protein
MGWSLATSFVMIVFVAVLTTSAQAQNDQQQWCAYFTGGPTNCGFTTLAQCLEAIRGKTALCERNYSGTAQGRERPSADH